jgi:hypothetical protein
MKASIALFPLLTDYLDKLTILETFQHFFLLSLEHAVFTGAGIA